MCRQVALRWRTQRTPSTVVLLGGAGRNLYLLRRVSLSRNCLRQGGRGRARRRCSNLLRGGRAPRQRSIRQFMQARSRRRNCLRLGAPRHGSDGVVTYVEPSIAGAMTYCKIYANVGESFACYEVCLAVQKLMPCAVKGHCEGVHSVRRAWLCSLAVQGAIYAREIRRDR